MTIDVAVIVTLGIFASGWFIWVTDSIYKHRAELRLIGAQMGIMQETRDILVEINKQLHAQRGHR